ncbi:unnamed protein product [Mycetohabitans rhizoxinica HKI 454]|uniref:Uncharacterized protein n=1 Tax=Mycetohabitans rhizoxinica (strain DSM 19002 / CIP 109453 / HKI 454) TaxID=882378 RepID=E5APH2_MYCRK|nr:unnamed protein product [Mycetohabitans rhizoxinica HKI 454]
MVPGGPGYGVRRVVGAHAPRMRRTSLDEGSRVYGGHCTGRY